MALSFRDLRSHWNFGDPAASRAAFEALLPLDGDKELALEIKCQIARTYGLEGRFEEGHGVLAGLAVADDPTLRSFASWNLEKGRTLNSSGKPEEARPFFEAACRSDWDDLRIDALHMMAIVSSGSEALEWNQKALAEAKDSTMPEAQRWIGSISNNLAWSLHDLGRLDEALEVFETAERFFAEKGGQGHHIAKWAVARCLRSLGRLEEALAGQKALLESGDGYVEEEMGENLLALGREEEARPHFARAYELLSQDDWLAKNEAARLERVRSYGSSIVTHRPMEPSQ